MTEKLANTSPLTLGAAWAGLDVSKKTFDAAIYFPLGPDQPPRALNEMPAAAFDRTSDGVTAFLRWADEQLDLFLKENAMTEPIALRAVMEATGRYSIDLTALLSKTRPALRPVVAHPKAASDFIKSLRIRNLNDRSAARGLARFGYDNKPEPPATNTPQLAELRELSRLRDAIVIQRVSAENRLTEVAGFKSAAKIQAQVVKSLTASEKATEKEINKLISKHEELRRDVERLETIPGVGRITATAVLAEAGDLRRFNRSRQLSAFAGLSPRTHDSGTSVHKRPRLSKQGTGRLRQALYLSAMSAIQRPGQMRDFYTQLVNVGKKKMQALGAVMRKQLLLMRALLIGNADYQGDYVSARNRPQAACA
jgi:transposase